MGTVCTSSLVNNFNNYPFLLWACTCKNFKMASFGKEEARRFTEDGYAVVEDFLSERECQILRDKMASIITQEDFSQHPIMTFNTQDNDRMGIQEYFLTSGDKIRYFFEEGALNKEKGKITIPIPQAINKIGHALHVHVKEFKDVTLSERVRGVARALGLVNPVIPQAMYIFKQPHIGGIVTPHQDSTFLYTTPHSLIGFWIALEDADIENSCLWFVPKSHHREPTRRFKRVTEEGVLATKMEGEEEEVGESEYKPCPVRKGSLVLIHGNVLHKSEPNVSNRSRHVYTFHLYDAGTSKWSKDNWLQPSPTIPFPTLY